MKEKQLQEEFYREFKLSRRSIILDTILSLLPDLSEQKRALLLEDRTPEELAESCFEIYDQVFDSYVQTISLAGANEVAWKEALGMFEEETGEEEFN